MRKFEKTGSRTGIALSLVAAAMIMPEAILAGPGCMNNQRMATSHYPYGPMGPQLVYGQRPPYPYSAAPAPYAGMMPAPCNRPMTARHSTSAVDGKQAANATSDTPSSGAATGENMTAGDSVTVRIDGMRFEPENITVKPGTRVTWVHGSQMPHTISGNTEGLRSGTLYNGQQFSHTFNEEGSYKYVCGLHPSMTGSVIVDEAAADS